MKQEELRKKSDDNLLRLKKELEFDKIKATCGSENMKSKEAKKVIKKGIRTSIHKQIRRGIAQINTEIRRREIEMGNIK